VFDGEYLAHQQPAMYPLPPFGVGANMAFRREVLVEIGGFDVGLGAGTATHGAEDTLAFSELLLAGWRMVYAPAAITWHCPRSDEDALLRQLLGYGIGIGAYYAALVRRDPRRLLSLVRLAPRAARDVRDPGSVRNASLSALPSQVTRANLRGIVNGPTRYIRA